MEPIFTDRNVRQVLGMHNLNYRDREGDETLYYRVGKAVRNSVEEKLQNGSLETLLQEIVVWQKTVFTQATSKSRAEHLYREAKELRDNPSDAEEMADVLFLLAGLAAGEGVDLVEACRKKLEINKAREWGKPDDQGVVEHVREDKSNSPYLVDIFAEEGDQCTSWEALF